MSLSQKAYKKQMEAQKKAVEAKQEAIVVFSREKLLPFFNEKERPLTEVNMMLDVLSTTINQGIYKIMEKATVSELELKQALVDSKNEDYKAILDILDDVKMDLAIESLQWLREKIKKQLSDENKDRMFSSLKLDF